MSLEVLDLVWGPEEVAERGLLEVLDLVWGPEEVTERGPLKLWTSSGDLKKWANEGYGPRLGT